MKNRPPLSSYSYNNNHHYNNKESLGKVNPSSSLLRRRKGGRRRKFENGQEEEPANNHDSRPRVIAKQQVTTTNNSRSVYKYNQQILKLVIPCFISLFIHSRQSTSKEQQQRLSNNDTVLLPMTLYCSLIIYMIDLSNMKHLFHDSIWFCFMIFMIYFIYIWCSDSSTSSSYMYDQEAEEDGNYFLIKMESWSWFIVSMIDLFSKISLYFCLSCWTILQCQWLYKDDREYTKLMEQVLHFMFPLSFISIVIIMMTITLTSTSTTSFSMMMYSGNNDNQYLEEEKDVLWWCTLRNLTIWNILPLFVIVSFSWSIQLLCTIPSSYNNEKDKIKMIEYENRHSNKLRYSRHNSRHVDVENTHTIQHKTRHQYQQQQQQQQRQSMEYYSTMENYYAIPKSIGIWLSTLLYTLPCMTYFVLYPIRWNYHQFLLTKSITTTMATTTRMNIQDLMTMSWMDFALELTIICIIPYLIQYHILMDQKLWWWCNETMTNNINNNNNTKRTSRNRKISIIVAMVVLMELLIHRYLIPLCIVSTHYSVFKEESKQHSLPLPSSKLWMSILLNCSFGLFGLSYYYCNHGNRSGKRPRISNNEKKNNHEIDGAMVIMIIMASLFLCEALGVTWNNILHSILFFIGYVTIIPTKKLKYALIWFTLLFITMSYTFWKTLNNSSNQTVWLIPNILEVSLIQLNMVFFIGTTMCGLIYYSLMKREVQNFAFHRQSTSSIDILGITFFGYSVFVMLAEGALLYNVVEYRGSSCYSVAFVGLSSILLFGITMLMKKRRIIKHAANMLLISIAVGKAVGSLIAISDNQTTDGSKLHKEFLTTSFVAILFIFVIALPYSLAEPIHISREKSSKNRFHKQPKSSLSIGASRLMIAYCFILMPIVIVISLPLLQLLLNTVMKEGIELQRSVSFYDTLGYTMALWGVQVNLILAHHLPHGGAEKWRKGALFCFIVGFIMCLGKASFVLEENNDMSDFHYAHLLSIEADKNLRYSSVLLLICALVALIIPSYNHLHNMRRKRIISKGRSLDSNPLIIMISGFTVCGVSWVSVSPFINGLSQIPFAILSISSTITNAFLVAVMVYNFMGKSEKEIIEKSFKVALIINLISGLLILLIADGEEKSASILILLLLWTAQSLILGVSFRKRQRKTLTSTNRANYCFLFTWILSTMVVYLYFGIASTGISNIISDTLGSYTSTVMTIFLSPVLNCIEANSTQRYGKAVTRGKFSILGNSWDSISRQSRYVLPLIASGIIFISTSFYVITLRGCLDKLHSAPSMYESIFQHHYGNYSRINHHADIRTLAMKHSSHYYMVKTASKLAASGYWTSNSKVGPLKHLCGLIAIAPSWFTIISSVWDSSNQVSSSTVWSILFAMTYVQLFCSGITFLKTAAFLGGIIQSHNWYKWQHANRKRKMVT